MKGRVVCMVEGWRVSCLRDCETVFEV